MEIGDRGTASATTALAGCDAPAGAVERWMVDTPRGPARVELWPAREPQLSLLALGHGAGGDVTATDLVALRHAAVAAGAGVALVTQPYRVAGRRAPAPAAALDEAWCAVLTALRGRWPAGLPLVVGGRSSGARVACRTARAVGAVGVVALAFPLCPPASGRSRGAELATGCPTLAINGDRDPFGVPAAGAGLEVVVRPGERHDLGRDPEQVARAAVAWLARHGWARSEGTAS